MKAEKVAVIADNCAELAALEAVGVLQVTTWLDKLYNRLSARQILLPVLLGQFLMDHPDAAADVALNHVMITVGLQPAIAVDEPTRVYFEIFTAVFRTLWNFVPEPEPAPPKPKPAAKPGEKGYAAKFGKEDSAMQRGFTKG